MCSVTIIPDGYNINRQSKLKKLVIFGITMLKPMPVCYIFIVY